MSEVAGRMSIQEGAKYLERPQMGRGILLAGVPGVAPAHITILGGGVVGANAARVAAGFRADVAIIDINMDRLRYLDDVMPPNVDCLFSDRHTIREQLSRADLVIGAVLIPGAKRRSGQPGRPEPHEARQRDHRRGDRPRRLHRNQPADDARSPTYIVEEVVHYCVTNMPGAVGRTSTFALCNVTLPWVIEIAQRGIEAAARDLRPVARPSISPPAKSPTRPWPKRLGCRTSRFNVA